MASAFFTSAASGLGVEQLFLEGHAGATIASVTTGTASVYQDAQTGRWMLSAWHTRNPGACESFGAVKTGLFYYFAEKEGRTASWPARQFVEKNYCVPGVRVRREMLNSGCTQGERSLGFRGRVAEGQRYTFSFN